MTCVVFFRDYTFKTGWKYIWMIAADCGETFFFIPCSNIKIIAVI